MKNKKILVGLVLMFILVACTSKTVDEDIVPKEETVHVSIYRNEYINLLDASSVNDIYGMGLDLDDGEIAMLGADLSSFTFKDYDGNEVNLSTKGPYVVEILGKWCQHCQKLTKEVLQETLDEGIIVYQYFLSADNEDIDSFYLEVGFNRPEGVTILKDCSDFEDWVNEKGITSVPQALFINEEGKISMSHIGYIDYETFKEIYDYSLTAKIYETQVDGLDLYTYLVQQAKIKNYVDNLKEIDIARSVLEEEYN